MVVAHSFAAFGSSHAPGVTHHKSSKNNTYKAVTLHVKHTLYVRYIITFIHLIRHVNATCGPI